jgi:hypothetical protein
MQKPFEAGWILCYKQHRQSEKEGFKQSEKEGFKAA